MNVSKIARYLALALTLAACSPQPVDVSENESDTLQVVMHEKSSAAKKEIKARHPRQMVSPSAVVAGRVMQDVSCIPPAELNTESYVHQDDSGFLLTASEPLSTFSIDVDTASYANVRRFVNQGTLPPLGAVRVEEMINYFNYEYPLPHSTPFSVSTEIGPCPWRVEHSILRIGLKGKEVDKKDLLPANLVFLIDVSGSMQSPNKLGLLKKSLKMLVAQLDGHDRISIVVYAGNDRIVLEPTKANERHIIHQAIDHLTAGGSTNGAQGIVTAYALARQTFMPKGNNRVILASDGDFNVGTTGMGELQRLIEKEKESGVYLSVLGFGRGNYDDGTMEILADKGNGNYGYIDNVMEAKKVLVRQMAGTLYTLAKDVKIQVEFNPAHVAAYRLIGYENRELASEDFNDDRKDAGEIGVGHTVTALYEIVPWGSKTALPTVDSLKYQQVQIAAGQHGGELATVKLRYKLPDADRSSKMSVVVQPRDNREENSVDFHFATAVAGYAMLLEKSQFKGDLDYADVIRLAKQGRGKDPDGYRAEFIRMVEMSEMFSNE